jgi:RNA polymerase sigma-70 factor (ECF subfamily)
VRRIGVKGDPSTADARRRRFEILFSEIYEPIQRYVRRRVEPDSVDDIVSETMLTLWRRLDDVPPDAVPWAYGVARRQVANHHRGSRRHLRLVQRAENEPRPMSAEAYPLDAELETALSALADSDRELVHLWAWEQLEPAEVGVVLGLTPNAASIRLHRAKKKLAQNLEIARKEQAFSGHSHRGSSKEERP